MKSTKIATRYALSLLELAEERNCIPVVKNDMEFLLATCNENPEFISFLNSPIINTEKKLNVLNGVFGEFDILSKNFAELIAKNRRESYLPEIAASFIAQLKEKQGIVPITIVSAVALTEVTKQQILDKVGKIAHGTLEVTEKVDPKLIGGFVVNMGDFRLDASTASQLTRLRQELLN
jgi:F-type H+-transporting ATPase subunit delta